MSLLVVTRLSILACGCSLVEMHDLTEIGRRGWWVMSPLVHDSGFLDLLYSQWTTLYSVIYG
jgi:hypothetical protein